MEKEAYGPSKNEGLCYESCAGIGFHGDIRGTLYFCMDGYTRMNLLPVIAKTYHIDTSAKGMTQSLILEFSNHIAAGIVQELIDGGFNLELEPPENLNNRLVPIDLALNRQYILIFFIRELEQKKYLGRFYLVLAMQKY